VWPRSSRSGLLSARGCSAGSSYTIWFRTWQNPLILVQCNSLKPTKQKEQSFYAHQSKATKREDKEWHQTSAWRPACNLTPVASYITCHQSLFRN